MAADNPTRPRSFTWSVRYASICLISKLAGGSTPPPAACKQNTKLRRNPLRLSLKGFTEREFTNPVLKRNRPPYHTGPQQPRLVTDYFSRPRVGRLKRIGVTSYSWEETSA